MVTRSPDSTLFPYTTLFRSSLRSRFTGGLARPRAVMSASGTRADSGGRTGLRELDRKSTRLNSSHQIISYAVFCLKKKKRRRTRALRPRVELPQEREHPDHR